MELSLIITGLFLFVIAYFLRTKTKNLQMPKVAGWPLIGCVFRINHQRMDLSFVTWARELGPVYALTLLNETFVVVSGYDEIMEMLVKKEKAFGGRPHGRIIGFGTYGRNGLLVCDADRPHWSCIKNAVYRVMRHYNDGLQPFLSTTNNFLANLKSRIGEDVDLQNDIYNFLFKVVVTTMSGRVQISDSDKTLIGIKRLGLLSAAVSIRDAGFLRYLFPWLSFLSHKECKEKVEVVHLRDNLWDLMWYDSQKTYTPLGDATCILNAFGQLLDKNSPHYSPTVDWEHAKAAFLDLIVASVNSMPQYAYILPNILVQNSCVLQRLQNEIDAVLGNERQPNLMDCDLMPYTMATIYELLRYGCQIPAMPHKTLENTTIGSFAIPKDTIVVPLFSALHMNSEFWGDPDVFRPERFLDDNGLLLSNDHSRRKHVLQFGAGLRSCVGKSFAVMRLFIFLVTMLQAFNILPGSGPLVSYNPKSFSTAITLIPLSYQVRLTPRYN